MAGRAADGEVAGAADGEAVGAAAGSPEGRGPAHPWTRKAMPMDAVFVLTVAILAFGGIAAALAWAEAQNREPSK